MFPKNGPHCVRSYVTRSSPLPPTSISHSPWVTGSLHCSYNHRAWVLGSAPAMSREPLFIPVLSWTTAPSKRRMPFGFLLSTAHSRLLKLCHKRRFWVQWLCRQTQQPFCLDSRLICGHFSHERKYLPGYGLVLWGFICYLVLSVFIYFNQEKKCFLGYELVPQRFLSVVQWATHPGSLGTIQILTL